MTKAELQEENEELKEEIKLLLNDENDEITELKNEIEYANDEISGLNKDAETSQNIDEDIKTMYMDNDPKESRQTITRLFFQSL